MILNIFKLNTELNYEDDLSDVDVSNYEFNRSEIVNCSRLNDIIEAVDQMYLDKKIEESDLIEIIPGSEEFEDIHAAFDIDFKNHLNYLMITGLGAKQIAVDGLELSLKAINEKFVF